MPLPNAPPQRVTLIRTDRFGDHMIFGGFLEILRKAWPQTRISLVLPEERLPLYEHCPLVDHLIAYASRGMKTSKRQRMKVYKRIEQTRPDYLINTQCMPCETAERIIRYCRAPVRFGVTGHGVHIDAAQRLRSDRYYTHLLDLGTILPWRSEKWLYGEILALLGATPQDFLPRIWTSPADVAYADKIYAESGFVPEKTLVYFCGSSHKLRSYPPLRDLMRRLMEEGPWTVLALGGSDEVENGEPPDESLRPRWRNLCGTNSIRESAELMRKSRLVLGVESGLAQAAVAVDAPHVILQSGTYFGRFLPISPRTSVAIQPLACYFCTELCRYEEAYCMSGVRPEVFLQAVREALAGPSAKARVYWSERPGPIGDARSEGFNPIWIDPAKVEVIRVAS